MTEHVLALAGALLWIATIAVVIQRQRVLHRRLRRLERRLGLRSQLAPAPQRARPTPVRLGYVGPPPPTSDHPPAPPPCSVPTVQQLARLAHPLQRAGA